MADIADIKYLEDCFIADFENGTLTWRKRPEHHFRTLHGCNIFNAQKAGCRADRLMVRGYRRVRVDLTVNMAAHRVLFFLFHGHLPKSIDHINGDRSDNRIVNLRGATASNNSHNTTVHRGSSKYKGVSWTKSKEVWRVFCTDASLGKYANGKNRQVCAGSFSDELAAAIEYDNCAARLYGDYAWLNRDHFTEVMEAYAAK